MPPYESSLNVAGVNFRIHSEEPLALNHRVRNFVGTCPGQTVDIICTCVEELPLPVGAPRSTGPNFEDYCAGKTQLRLTYSDMNFTEPICLMSCGEENRLLYCRKWEHFFRDLDAVFSRVMLEKLLIGQSRMVFHAALVDTAFGGLLFSGPSGIGKSTQADLWAEHEGGRIINGDKPILCRRDRWLGFGSPYAGSSACHVNETAPVRAIILLGQGPECTLTRLSPREAFPRLYEQTALHSWDDAFHGTACDMLVDLAQSVPVYRLVCTPDRAAVEILKAELLRKDVQ